MADDDMPDRPSRPRFIVEFLFWFVCVGAIVFSVYYRWFAKTYAERAIEAEMVAEDNGVRIIDAWVSYYGAVNPPRYDKNGHVNFHYCRPYVDLTDPSLRTDDIDRLLPYVRNLLPDKGKMRVAVFLSSERFANASFVARLREELPRCEMFDRAIAPGFFRTSEAISLEAR